MPEVRTLEVGVGRVRVLEVGVEEVGLLEVGAGQRRAPQVGVVEARPPQVGVRQVELRRLRVGSANRPRPSTVKAAWQEIAELMESSYRQVALKRMLKTLDG